MNQKLIVIGSSLSIILLSGLALYYYYDQSTGSHDRAETAMLPIDTSSNETARPNTDNDEVSIKGDDESTSIDLIEREDESSVYYSLGADEDFAQLDCAKRSGVFDACSSDCAGKPEAICTQVCRMICVVKPGTTYEAKDLHLTLRLPEGFERQSEKPLSFVLRGASQTGETEFFDGISISFERLPLRGAALQAVVDLDLQEAANVGDIVTPATETQVASFPAWSFRANISGEMDYFYIATQDDEYLRITTMTPDPQRRGYAAILSDLLDSLRLID